MFCVLPFMAINQLKAGAFLSYISIGLNNIVGLLYTPYMLRMLGQNEYGLFSQTRLFVIPLNLGLMGRLRNNMRCLECFLSFILLLGLLLFP